MQQQFQIHKRHLKYVNVITASKSSKFVCTQHSSVRRVLWDIKDQITQEKS
jgi:hypothetical protein